VEIGLFHGIQWPEGSGQRDRYRQGLEQACAADERGFDSVWLTEHHFSRHGIVSDSLALLAHLAARTDRVRLGTAVSVLPLHNPLRFAETAATVDVLSGGRLDLGIGRGYQASEFSGFGVDIAEKHARFDEAVEVLRLAWGADAPFTHHGSYFQYEGAAPQPRPLQQPHPPIWVATDSPEGLASCVEREWGVLLPQGTSLSRTATSMARYHDALRAGGKGPRHAKVFLARATYVAKTDEQAWEDAARPYEQFLALADQLRRGTKPGASGSGRSPFDLDADMAQSVLFGSPETVLEGLRAIRALGIERVMVYVHLGALPHEKIMQSLDLFAREVLPAAREL